ncbi:hypothetical protein [Poseidonocella sedimentorum]|uniref:Uncharacterized protein n=1 Tax=Poseidonocella sedimentorum TaxID=871652 RepID=A0A1I6CVI4_9RHOB|nr:hypothetical protein [Poseidonocella sedimentorum]SFQ97113.1 hypothetical protein SAMN04515673_101432 [Poseidonocella sedimentorum]
MSPIRRSLLCVIGPGIVWAVHFTTVYALISAACAPRDLIDYPGLLLSGGLATVFALGLCLLPVLCPPRAGPPELIRAAFWSGLIFSLAVLANAGALVFFQSCGG